MKEQISQFAFWFALVAVLLSFYTFYINYMYSSIEIFASKQIRLYVSNDKSVHKNNRPIILTAFGIENKGGKSSCIQDIKLNIEFINNNKTEFIKDFLSLREIPNLLLVEGAFQQEIVKPIIVKGKSVEYKQYVFEPKVWSKDDIVPEYFSMKISIYLMQNNKWEFAKSFSTENINNIWNDLDNDSSFKSIIINIKEQ